MLFGKYQRSEFMWKLPPWAFLSRYVSGFFCRPWIKRKGEIRKGHVCFGSGKLCFYQKKGISDKIWKTTTKRRLLVWQHCSHTLQCLSECNWPPWRNTGGDSWLEGANGRYGEGGGWVVIAPWIASTCPLSDVSALSHKMIVKDFISRSLLFNPLSSLKNPQGGNVASFCQMPRTSSQIYLSIFFPN